jgi:hypothetical protein
MSTKYQEKGNLQQQQRESSAKAARKQRESSAKAA